MLNPMRALAAVGDLAAPRLQPSAQPLDRITMSPYTSGTYVLGASWRTREQADAWGLHAEATHRRARPLGKAVTTAVVVGLATWLGSRGGRR